MSATPAMALGRPGGELVLRAGGCSVRLALRPAAVALALAVVLAAALPLAVAAGPGGLDPLAAALALLGDGGTTAVMLARDIRLPRVLAAVLAGAALAAAGCLIQGLARNRLATPAVLGINEGATLAVLLSVYAGGAGTVGPWWVAPLGAFAATGLLLALAGDMGPRGYRVLVVGLALSAVLRSTAELGLSWSALQHASAVYTWSLGSLSGRGWEVSLPVAAAVVVLLPAAVTFARRVALLGFDEGTATALGVAVRRCQLQALILAVTLSGLAVGIGGPVGGSVGFIALASPIVARRLVGPARVPVVVSALVGALLLVIADTVGRVIAAPAEVPAGVVTSVIGGPFLLWVLFSEETQRG